RGSDSPAVRLRPTRCLLRCVSTLLRTSGPTRLTLPISYCSDHSRKLCRPVALKSRISGLSVLNKQVEKTKRSLLTQRCLIASSRTTDGLRLSISLHSLDHHARRSWQNARSA